MRHLARGRKLNRTTSHRLALRRNLVQSLIEHGAIRTTLAKAKEVQAFAERLATLAIDGGLAARQSATALLNDRSIIPKEHREAYDQMSDAKRDKVLRSRSGRRYRTSTTKPGVKFTAESVIQKLFVDVGPKMKKRNEALGCGGGYTRIIKLLIGGSATVASLPSSSGSARTTDPAPRAPIRPNASAGPREVCRLCRQADRAAWRAARNQGCPEGSRCRGRNAREPGGRGRLRGRGQGRIARWLPACWIQAVSSARSSAGRFPASPCWIMSTFWRFSISTRSHWGIPS